MSLREDIAQQALSLAAEDRVYVADLLEQSLGATGAASAEIDAAWSAEIDRRIAAYDRGEIQASDFETALGRMQRYLVEHRDHKATL